MSRVGPERPRLRARSDGRGDFVRDLDKIRAFRDSVEAEALPLFRGLERLIVET